MIKKMNVPYRIDGANGCAVVALDIDYNAAWGVGERFDGLNLKGKTIKVKVFEKFCEQGENSYCPIPFFFTDTHVGVYVDTLAVTEFVFEEKISIKIFCDLDNALPELYLFFGKPKEILHDFCSISGKAKIVPKWSLGVWMSANRWHNQDEILEELEQHRHWELPASVVVIEAWSDRATFYRWNENGEWEDPEALIKLLHSNGLRVILWQVPVIKKLEPGRRHKIHEMDWDYVVEHGLCVLNKDGTPYTIPESRWFSGSLVPDFTNPETKKWWFDKRQYLLDMGVDGFKTDGGEFIYSDDVIFYDGSTGKEMKNGYALSYVSAYTEFIGEGRVLFSRAGYAGQQQFPIQWAGDQKSTWEELRHVLGAGLSSGLSGISLWGFDLAGFAGPMPSIELYERATQMAVFSPIMQWHSEPVGGQFAKLMPSKDQINDRSPWNMAQYYNDAKLIDRLRFHYNLRANLIPYLYDLLLKSAENGLPLMKHPILEYPEDKHFYDEQECFMLGDLMIYPILREKQQEINIYLPEGIWYCLWNSQSYLGGHSYKLGVEPEKIPVFIRAGGCVALNLSYDLCLGSYVEYCTDTYSQLCFLVAGDEGRYHFRDDFGNDMLVQWREQQAEIKMISGCEKARVIFIQKEENI